MKKGFDSRRLDVRRFAEEEGRIETAEPLSGFGRLVEETQGRGTDEPLSWSARGEMLNPGHVQPQVWIHLHAATRLVLTCQRCLQPVQLPVTVERSFRFVNDEATAASEDEDAEEDVLAESRSFDLRELIEDEVLLAIPLVPRHVICPVVLPTSAGEAELEAGKERKANPFEVLEKLRQPKS
jgi:uncharacterized protein